MGQTKAFRAFKAQETLILNECNLWQVVQIHKVAKSREKPQKMPIYQLGLTPYTSLYHPEGQT